MALDNSVYRMQRLGLFAAVIVGMVVATPLVSGSQGREKEPPLTPAQCWEGKTEAILDPCSDKERLCPNAGTIYKRYSEICTPLSPAELAAKEREKQAEAAKRAASARAAAARQQEINLETQKLGQHRRAEAERLVAMREAAAKARGQSIIAAAALPGGGGHDCQLKSMSNVPSGSNVDKDDAMSQLRRSAAGRCNIDTGSDSYTLSAIRCEHVRRIMRRRGEPAQPSDFRWDCFAKASCTAKKEVCAPRPSKARQE